MERTITVATSRVQSLEQAVRSLGRAAKRLGVAPLPLLSVNWSTRRELKQTSETAIMDGATLEDVDTRITVVAVVDCVITLPDCGASAPGQWRVAGVIERVRREDGSPGERTNEIFCDPKDLPKLEVFRHAELGCEHCQARRLRAKTLVLEEAASGRQIQVGKECAVNYVGDRYERDIESLHFQEFIGRVIDPYAEEAERGFRGCGGPLSAWDAEEVMAHANACVRTRGWQPAKIKAVGRLGFQEEMPNPDATSAHVKAVLTGEYLTVEALAAARAELSAARIKAEADLAAIKKAADATPVMIEIFSGILIEAQRREAGGIEGPPYDVTEADRAQAREQIAWLAAQTPDPEKDNFLASLKACFEPGWISEKRLSFAVALVRVRDLARTRAEIEAGRARSEFVGQPGERREFSVTVRTRIPYASQFGPGIIYLLHDDSGNTLKWMTSGTGLPEGNTFKIKGTIKRHAEYRGEKQTELTRVKLIEEPTKPAPPETGSPAQSPVRSEARLEMVEQSLAISPSASAPAR
ncbi:MAG: hypothetical protein PHE83_17620 [Opitutaceae bacterium]|nr:hypothetical protein [Opitutaceae bacterium]